MKKHILFFCLLVITISNSIKAQPITCSSFSINSIYQDTIDPTQAQINITFNGGANQIANYPHVSLLLDCNGDTIANGGLFWFGQLGQTSQDYPVNLTGTLGCTPMTAIFVFGDSLGNTITCPFTFGTTSVKNFAKEYKKTKAFPNPAKETLFVDAGVELYGETFTIYDFTGKISVSGVFNLEKNEIDIRLLKRGIYMLFIGNKLDRPFKFIKD